MGVGPACRILHPLAFPSGSWATFPTCGTVPYKAILSLSLSFLIKISGCQSVPPTLPREHFSSALRGGVGGSDPTLIPCGLFHGLPFLTLYWDSSPVCLPHGASVRPGSGVKVPAGLWLCWVSGLLTLLSSSDGCLPCTINALTRGWWKYFGQG